ncbi:MAG: TRIC cation channel family protein [Anaerolineae bacterium]
MFHFSAYEFQVPLSLELIATFTWALSGAIVGVRQGFDEVGVFVIALVSAFGGGIIRDGLFLNRPPVVTTEPMYLAIVSVAVLVILLLGRYILRIKYLDKVIGYIDAIGTPAFCIVGLQLGLAAPISLPGVLLLGIISGVGGGILRDMMTIRVPALLRPGQFSTFYVFLACLLYLGLARAFGVNATWAAWLTITAFFIARVITIQRNWKSVPVATYVVGGEEDNIQQ